MIKRDVTYSESNKYCWTEDNRLQAMSDKNNGAWYNYDATGERNLKLTGQTYYINQNGQDYYTPIFDQQTLYASSLVTVNDKGYTKHYFEEGKRICSKIGSGELQDIWTLSTPIEGDYQEIHDHRSIGGVIKIFDICMGLPVEIKNKDLFKEIILQYESQVNPDEPVFYYHGDHLGSASYITDDHGNETQHLVYLPFGEDWVDMKYNVSQFETPYKFNGKEKDPETGYHYYGARYLNTDLSIWLSVDPMSDKYPHLTSYNYCANNPVMLVDPDGREIWIALETPCPFLKQFVQYKNGKLYERNGGEYRGNNSFAMKTKNDLITLSESNKLKKRISTLENSERKHTIENTYNKNGGNYNEANAKDLKNNKPTDSKTYYNPDKQTTNRGDKRDPKNGLAHELLSHGYDADQGTYDNKKTENGISMSEVNAVNVENVSRKLTGDKKRTTYGGKTIPPKLLKD